MKRCIWCNRTEGFETFNKKAHTFPQSMGGKNICENVCDSCNKYFGSPNQKMPAVEVVLKEILNISRHLIATPIIKKKIGRYKSEYFNVNWERRSIKLKPRYNLSTHFQEKLGRQFKRGLYKVFLEERERQIMDAHNSKFDFIREFARYDFNDYPLYYLIPKIPVVMISDEDTINPTLKFSEYSTALEKEFGVYFYYIMGHSFCIPISKNFENFHLERYQKHLIETQNPLGTQLVEIKQAGNIDFTFKFLFN